MNKLKDQKGAVSIIVIVVLTIVVIGAGGVIYQSFNKEQTFLPVIPLITEKPEKAEQTPEPTLKSEAPLEVNFSEEGNILNWDSQTESYTENWTLLYEKPSNPALSVKLIFNENSICDLGEGEEGICDKSLLNNGDRAKVDGLYNNREIIVINLKKLPTL